MTDREKFEAFAATQGLEVTSFKPDGRYWSSHTHMAWVFWQASRKQMAEEAALEIELGKVALRFSDRAGDVCAEIDPADRICAEFYAAVSEVFERHYPSRRSLATPTEGKT